ncbi:DNAse I-like superfamily protein, partial [Klebsormidium nitens]
MLSVLRTHLPSDIPIAGCELTPYVLLRKPDNSITTDDIPEGAPVQGYYLQCKWLRVKNEKRVAVCSVHPSEVATLQCLLCVKAKLPAAKSYHCSPQCFAAAWRNHKELHARAAAAPAKDQNGNNTAPEEEELFGTGPPGSSHATRRSIIGLPNGAAYPAP